MNAAKRLHNPKTDGTMKGGTAITQNIEKFLKDKGIEILTETPATELITDDNGNVIGVMAESNDSKIKINAKKVILASGGYARSEELLERFIPGVAGSTELSAATVGSTGDGLIMAEDVGAALYEEPWVIGLAIASKVGGTDSIMMDWSKMYVNGQGERFMNEQSHYSVVTNKVMEEDVKWLVMDSNDSNSDLIETLESAMATEEVEKADTFEDLAEKMGVPADTFIKTMETYNKGAKAGKDALGKDKEYTVAVEKAPYYALKIYPKTMGTFAGVKTDENYRVLKEDGSVINNLYAGGEMANKVLYNQVYMTGSSVQFALTSGRLAGEHAAQNLE